MNSNRFEIREGSLKYLVYRYLNQSALGAKLKKYGLSQATISDIVRSKRVLSRWEARKIEEVLAIPDGWMDKEDWVRSGWHLIQAYQDLDEGGRKLFNQTVTFVEEAKKARPEMSSLES
jgi:hypothetical protein